MIETIYIIRNESRDYGEFYIGDERIILSPSQSHISKQKPTSYTANLKVSVSVREVSVPATKKKLNEGEK